MEWRATPIGTVGMKKQGMAEGLKGNRPAKETGRYLVRCGTYACAAYISLDGKWRNLATHREIDVKEIVARV